MIATTLSRIEGELGELRIAGSPVEELAGRTTLEELAARLWGRPPQELGEWRARAWHRLRHVLPLARGLAPVDGVRLAVSALPEGPPEAFTAAVAVATAGLLGGERPDPALGHTADFLRMARGAVGTPAEVAALETYLVTVAEHGLNASTFAARVIASTRAGTGAAVAGALGALKGPLHGGAPGPVLDMLDEIGRPDRASEWIADRLRSGERLMGFGHRIYRVRDPRVAVLRAALEGLRRERRDLEARLALADAVEAAALQALARHRPDRRLDTNVEFATALLLEALGFPRESFTAVFAVGRVVGWCGHVLEQERDGRLIRPA